MIEALEGRHLAAFPIFGVGVNSTEMPKKPSESTSKYSESTLLRLEVGTIARIDDVLERFEERSHMLREAIEREIERRKRNSAKK